MTRDKAIEELKGIEEVLISTAGIDWEYSTSLLNDYAIRMWALKFSDDNYPMEEALRLQEITDKLEKENMPDNYVIYTYMLAIILEPIRRKDGISSKV